MCAAQGELLRGIFRAPRLLPLSIVRLPTDLLGSGFLNVHSLRQENTTDERCKQPRQPSSHLHALRNALCLLLFVISGKPDNAQSFAQPVTPGWLVLMQPTTHLSPRRNESLAEPNYTPMHLQYVYFLYSLCFVSS